MAFFVGIGAVGWVSYLTFYGALAIGPISVLSPIVSGYAAVTVLLAVLFAGNSLSGLQAVAVGITIAGAMLASADVRAIVHTKLQRRSVLGFVLALCAMALLGAFVFGVSYYRAQLGWLAPIFLARAFATVFLLGHVLAGGGGALRRVQAPVPEIDAVAAGAGPLAAGAVAVPRQRAFARGVPVRAAGAAGAAGHRRLRVLQPRRRSRLGGDRRGGVGAVRGGADRHGGLAVQGATNGRAVGGGRRA